MLEAWCLSLLFMSNKHHQSWFILQEKRRNIFSQTKSNLSKKVFFWRFFCCVRACAYICVCVCACVRTFSMLLVWCLDEFPLFSIGKKSERCCILHLLHPHRFCLVDSSTEKKKSFSFHPSFHPLLFCDCFSSWK